jgi:hypothetical protein
MRLRYGPMPFNPPKWPDMRTILWEFNAPTRSIILEDGPSSPPAPLGVRRGRMRLFYLSFTTNICRRYGAWGIGPGQANERSTMGERVEVRAGYVAHKESFY